jgi:hypothetical protein
VEAQNDSLDDHSAAEETGLKRASMGMETWPGRYDLGGRGAFSMRELGDVEVIDANCLARTKISPLLPDGQGLTGADFQSHGLRFRLLLHIQVAPAG